MFLNAEQYETTTVYIFFSDNTVLWFENNLFPDSNTQARVPYACIYYDFYNAFLK